MPDIPTSAVDVESLVRAGLVELFSGMDGLPHVLDYAIYVEGEADYVRKFGYKHPASGRMEFRLLEIVFADFKDTDAGCEDNPVYDLNYTLTLIVSHADKRTDGTSSTDDFARFTLTLRDRVLHSRHISRTNSETEEVETYPALRVQPLTATGASFGPDETLNLRMAHVGTFTLAIEVTPRPA